LKVSENDYKYLDRKDKVRLIFDPVIGQVIFKSQKFEYYTDVIKKEENYRIMVATEYLDKITVKKL